VSQSVTIPGFVDAETPIRVAGKLYLANAPNPPSSLQLFKNGLLISAQGGDYVLAGPVATLNPAPADADIFVAWYRI
jgi:hypothetical protein